MDQSTRLLYLFEFEIELEDRTLADDSLIDPQTESALEASRLIDDLGIGDSYVYANGILE